MWRYNFPRRPELDCLRVYKGPIGVGLVPLADDADVHVPDDAGAGQSALSARRAGGGDARKAGRRAAAHRARSRSRSPTTTRSSTGRSRGSSSKGPGTRAGSRCSAMPSTPPRRISARVPAWRSRTASCWPRNWLAQTTPQAAFAAFRARRFERCRYIVEQSLAICGGQLGRRPPVDQGQAVREMFEVTAQPI